MIKIAHRGASGYAPENTLTAFKKALEMGVDGIELDVHLSKDGHVVVLHDPFLLRTTKTFGWVSKKLLKELQQLDAGKGEKIPTLQEVLNLVDKRVKVNIELKAKGTARAVSEIIKIYVATKKWKYDNFFVSSFDHKELLEFKKLIPQIKIGAIIIGINIQFEKYKKELGAYSVSMWLPCVTKSVVQKAHKRGLKVFVYTVNDVKKMNKMKELGVDGIIGNYPDRFK
ncbi:MAG TPA: glycerophosphodiester phosphodiesterase family protein [Candidatus Saccharimonadales bacterium]|nr:glycerophosphodiester phosphodiesterase family protein [Candidatus Saccharimonadales bacterium]